MRRYSRKTVLGNGWFEAHARIYFEPLRTTKRLHGVENSKQHTEKQLVAWELDVTAVVYRPSSRKKMRSKGCWAYASF